jgi:hypothetical protein
MNTRFTTISPSKAGNCAQYQSRWLGTQVIYTTWDGECIQGTITGFRQWFAIATFADGTWAQLDTRIEVVNA